MPGIRERLIDLADIDGEVRRDQAEATAKAIMAALPSNLVVAFVITLMMWNELPSAPLLGWLGAIAAINGGRYVILRRARISGALGGRPDQFLKNSSIGAMIGGIAWGVLGIACDVILLDHVSMLLFVLAGLASGAVALGPAHARTSLGFAVPILGGTVIGRLIIGDVESLLFAVAAIFFTLMLSRSALHAERNFREGSRTKHAATALAEALKVANAETLAKAHMLEVQASHDALTGLPNRSAFANALSAKVAAGRHRAFGLMMLDLDRFKLINDNLGHGAGDAVLIEVAARLRATLGPDDFPARLGGDEFAIILDGGGSPEAAARAVLDAFARPFAIAGRPASIGASIGIASFPADADSAGDPMVSADLALYAVKEGGRQGIRRFDARLHDAVQVRRDVERDLPVALAEQSIEVWCQPQVALADHSLVGIELLLRWKHERHGWISPPDIVAAARSTNRSDALTLHVVAEACRLIRRLRTSGRGSVIVAVNVSPQELGTYPLAERIAAILASEGVPAPNLEIEITEDAAIGGGGATREINALAELGVRIAIDDFGAGYSSFVSLRTLQIRRIKIDRGFITGMTTRESDRVLVQAILGIGQSLGLDVVAEGVENADEALLLSGYGCRTVQGYYFARPMPGRDLDAWMAVRAGSTALTRADSVSQDAGQHRLEHRPGYRIQDDALAF